MILRSLTVSGLRCFRNPVELNDFSEGINIIYGPNESGKSTLISGLVLAFLNRHDMTGEAIEAFRPWATSLSPSFALNLPSRVSSIAWKKVSSTKQEVFVRVGWPLLPTP